ncbi:myosin-11-like [Dorcoceras hygrometricum]|nr:myosin-11-like [Dorcoceras hygrometricum]
MLRNNQQLQTCISRQKHSTVGSSVEEDTHLLAVVLRKNTSCCKMMYSVDEQAVVAKYSAVGTTKGRPIRRCSNRIQEQRSSARLIIEHGNNQFIIGISILGKTESELIKRVLDDDLDEVSEWIKWTSKYIDQLGMEQAEASEKLKSRKEQNKLSCRQKEAQMQNFS